MLGKPVHTRTSALENETGAWALWRRFEPILKGSCKTEVFEHRTRMVSFGVWMGWELSQGGRSLRTGVDIIVCTTAGLLKLCLGYAMVCSCTHLIFVFTTTTKTCDNRMVPQFHSTIWIFISSLEQLSILYPPLCVDISDCIFLSWSTLYWLRSGSMGLIWTQLLLQESTRLGCPWLPPLLTVIHG